MDAIEQAERVALRASDQCVVFTLREAQALLDFLDGMGFEELAPDDTSDLARMWRVLNAQVGYLQDQRQDGPD